MAKATYKPVASRSRTKRPSRTIYDRELAAFNRMKDTISMGATIGTLVGGLGGGAVGCVLAASPPRRSQRRDHRPVRRVHPRRRDRLPRRHHRRRPRSAHWPVRS